MCLMLLTQNSTPFVFVHKYKHSFFFYTYVFINVSLEYLYLMLQKLSYFVTKVNTSTGIRNIMYVSCKSSFSIPWVT